MLTHFIFLLAIFFAAPFMNRKRRYYVFSFILLFFFLAVRFNFGNDYKGYQDMYTSIQAGLITHGADDILYKLLNQFSPSFYIMIVISSLLYMIAIYFLITKNLDIRQYWMGFLILLINPYLFLIHLSSIRQTLAISFVVIAMVFAVKRQLIPYILMILVATGFHRSAIIMLPIYFFLTESKIKRRWLVALVAGTAVLVFTPILNIVLGYAFQIFPRYASYVDLGQPSGLRTAFISFVLFLIVIFNINKLEGRAMVYGKLALLAGAVSLIAVKIVMIARIGMYFEIFLVVAFPHILSSMKLKVNQQIVFWIIITIYAMRYVSFFLNPEWSPYYGNYQTIFGALPF